MRALCIIFCLLAPLAALAADKPNQLTPEEKKEGFILLFNGKSLEGWEGDPAFWSVENEIIAGSTDRQPTPKNTFLICRKPYSDFILRLQVKLRNGNTGVQFRSRTEPDYVVAGYQADASEDGEKSAWGNFYEEKGRGLGVMKTRDEGWEKGKTVVRRGDWNSFEIFAQGNRIRLTLNGLTTIDTTDDKASEGVIALQLHRGAPMRVEFRNIRIKPLVGR